MRYLGWLCLSLLIASWVAVITTAGWNLFPGAHSLALVVASVLNIAVILFWRRGRFSILSAKPLSTKPFKVKPIKLVKPPRYVWDEFDLAWLEANSGLRPRTPDDWAEVITWFRENLHRLDEMGWPKSAQEDSNE